MNKITIEEKITKLKWISLQFLISIAILIFGFVISFTNLTSGSLIMIVGMIIGIYARIDKHELDCHTEVEE